MRAFLFALAIASVNSQADCSPLADVPLRTGMVKAVIDGDTLVLQGGERLRLIGVNTPEMGHDGKSNQPLAALARTFVTHFLDSGTLLYQIGEAQRDRYGRLLAYVFDENRRNLEEALIGAGMGWHVAIPPNNALSRCLADSENRARRAGQGVWNNYQPLLVSQLKNTGYQLVRGVVTRASTGKNWTLWLGNEFLAVVFPEYQAGFDDYRFKSLIGKEVVVRGWIYRSKGLWRVNLHSEFDFLKN